MTTLKYSKWAELAHDQYALTIDDILKLKKGDQIKVLCIHRNVWDGTLKDKNRGKSMIPQNFFKKEWAIYVHEEGLRGRCLLFAFECKKDIDYIDDVDKLLSGKICQPNFEFDIEYKKNCWYPLRQGCLPASDPQGFSKFPWTEEKHWNSFPESTLVGWRGCMVLWSKLKLMPNIIYPYPKEAFNAFDNEDDVTIFRSFTIESNDATIQTLSVELDYQTESFEYAARRFCGNVRKAFKRKRVKLPVTFTIDVIETTLKSKYQKLSYQITLEPDEPMINGLQRLGRTLIEPQ